MARTRFSELRDDVVAMPGGSERLADLLDGLLLLRQLAGPDPAARAAGRLGVTTLDQPDVSTGDGGAHE